MKIEFVKSQVPTVHLSSLRSGDVYMYAGSKAVYMYLDKISYNGRLEHCSVDLTSGYVGKVELCWPCIPLPNARLVIEQPGFQIKDSVETCPVPTFIN